MTTRKYTERRLYFFTCDKCGRINAQSFKRRKVKTGLCRPCRKHEVDKNQLSLIKEGVWYEKN